MAIVQRVNMRGMYAPINGSNDEQRQMYAHKCELARARGYLAGHKYVVAPMQGLTLFNRKVLAAGAPVNPDKDFIVTDGTAVWLQLERLEHRGIILKCYPLDAWVAEVQGTGPSAA